LYALEGDAVIGVWSVDGRGYAEQRQIAREWLASGAAGRIGQKNA
jgi:hypothetical protein